MPYQPIESYGIIGDLRTVALVGMNGSIDFLCFPDFDSPTVFAALLDDEKGGRFSVCPALADARHRQMYLPDTNVLLTRFLSAEGVAEISDYMPVGEAGAPGSLVRRAKTVRGEVRYRMVCAPRFDYARAGHRVESRGDRTVVFVSEGEDGTALRLTSGVPITVEDGAAVAEFTLAAGKSVAFVLEQGEAGEGACTASTRYVPETFKGTVNFWRRWLAGGSYRGRWRDAVNRSALTLKLLTSTRHGSIVAAPTFGLPEEIGGERNWDYRYTWIRDASFTLYALIRLGFTEESTAFARWIEERCGDLGPDGSLQIMYGLDGRRELTEEVLEHLEGYRGSSPVRIGNGAYDQLQLDIYGELMDTIYLTNKYGEPISHDLWEDLLRLLRYVEKSWRLADEGIWEVRGGRREFLYSRLMCWVAIDRAIRLARKRSFPAPLDRWEALRDEIYGDVFRRFWDEGRGAFVQALGSTSVDAASLLMPLVKFISPGDPRWLSTMRAIEEDLVDDSLVYRYRPEEAASDGLEGEEGSFSICSFWYVECLSRAGDVEKARFAFEKMLGYANHLGLYAEELGPSGEHLGNFPQAFTHLALISAAHHLDRQGASE
jgi:GH15 family glucan-1,4-alpha-glucosidase